MKKLAVGDRVKYRREFLQSTGQHTGDIPFARGTITRLKTYGSMTLAGIEWDDPEIPRQVAVANLTLASDPERI